MSKSSDTRRDAEALRQHAERKVAAKPKPTEDKAIDPHRLVHELQVYQIELEMQNEALREARTTAELALERYTELFDFAPIAYFTLATDSLIQQANFRGKLLLGSERFNLSGQHFINHVTYKYQPVFKRFLEQVFVSNDPQRCEIIVKAAGVDCWVSVEAIADSTRQSCLTAVLDFSERKRREQELQLAATIYLTLEEAMMVVDESNQIVAVNPAFTRLTGYTSEEAIGRPSSLLKSERHDQIFYRELGDRLNKIGRWQGELWNRRKNGDEYLAWLSISTLYSDSGEAIRRVAIFSDITEKKQVEEAINKQANLDPLTGLPNRRLFLDRLQRAVNKSHREHQKLALMFLDLDHFKDINDTLGHDTGDLLLIEVAQRLQGCIRETDTLARPGGDEFTLIMSELNEPASIDRVAQCLLQTMKAPFQLKNERCYASVSIGIALYPDDADNLEELLKKADQAMYSAKRQGRSRFCYFTPAMQEAAESRLRLTNDLRHALAEQQIWLAYQPIVELATGALHKAEALIRWQHPTRGLINPSEFIPIAEDTGMIIEIGNWVFQQAARQVAQWRSKYCPNFQISINKSPVQFYNNNDSLIYWLDYLQQLGLPGDAILVEITEGLLLDASAIVSEKLLAYRDVGIQVSLDDFGTGYSSLSYLKKLDIDYLKIDQSFVSNLTVNSTDLTICEAMILMAGKLGMKVVAEGIETLEQRDLLIQAGCEYGQGRLFSKPVSAEAFEKLFQTE